MKYQWNWTEILQNTTAMNSVFAHRANTITHDIQAILNLSFENGLRWIVTRVPEFDQQRWQQFRTELAQHDSTNTYVGYWLHLAQLIRDYGHDVPTLLNYAPQRAVEMAQTLLETKPVDEQFAFMVCLYYLSQDDMQAQLLFHYLLNTHDPHTQQIRQIRQFYDKLTDRQQDVAVLAARGYTNDEIADTLVIQRQVVADHMTVIYAKLQDTMNTTPDKHGSRYRLIHWLTRLFEAHPELVLSRKL
jgi:DNA-binding CsgD family transcriptional regulator